VKDKFLPQEENNKMDELDKHHEGHDGKAPQLQKDITSPLKGLDVSRFAPHHEGGRTCHMYVMAMRCQLEMDRATQGRPPKQEGVPST
jgi:hypothetical protein